MKELILWPVLVQIFLTIGIFILLGVRKAAAVKAKQVDLKKTALNNSAWPEPVVLVSNNIANQFQTPVLFYTICLSFLALDAVTVSVLVTAWIYSLSRLVHAYIHVGSNYVPHRFRIFLIGVVCLLILSILLVGALV